MHFSEWTLVSASILSGNYLQILCLRCADHSKCGVLGWFVSWSQEGEGCYFIYGDLVVFQDPKIFIA